MSDEDKKEYEVGYGKPPKSSQFQKGESGNPKGRPKGARNFKKLVDDMLRRRVAVNVNGKRKTVNLVEAALLRLGESAMQGDLKAIDKIMSLSALLSDEETAAARERELSAADREILENFTKQNEAAPPTGSGNDASNNDNTDEQD